MSRVSVVLWIVLVFMRGDLWVLTASGSPKVHLWLATVVVTPLILVRTHVSHPRTYSHYVQRVTATFIISYLYC